MSEAFQILVAGGVLLAAIVVLTVAYKWLRRRLDRPDESTDSGFSIEVLERLHGQGAISDGEFERLRQQALGLDQRGPGLTPGAPNDDEEAGGRS